MIVSNAKTASEFRKEVVAYFDDELARHEAQTKCLPPKTKRDELLERVKRRMIENNRDWFYRVLIDGKDLGE